MSRFVGVETQLGEESGQIVQPSLGHPLQCAVSADRGGRVMEIEVTVQASSEHEAITIGQAAIRAAIHAAGLSTSWWPSHDEVVSLLPTDLQTTRLSTAVNNG